MSRASRPLGMALAVLALLLAVCTTLLSWAYLPLVPGSDRQEEVEVPPGATTGQIATLLKERDLLGSPLAFRIVARLRGSEGRLRSGTYRLGPGMSPAEILARLERGDVVTLSFTIPEGVSAEEIARLLAGRGLADERELLAAFRDPTPVADLLPSDRGGLRYPLEGYLFPETYRLAKGTGPRELARILVQGFRAFWTPERQARAERLGLTAHQVLTLASIVEEETGRPEERPVVAGVFWNRLRLGMRLDADPTVQYALGKYGQPLTRQDLEIDSPWNTYRRAGLPPGPIASPGREAIDAVLHPAEVPYLFFVARPDGSHAFAVTLAEHNANVARYAAGR